MNGWWLMLAGAQALPVAPVSMPPPREWAALPELRYAHAPDLAPTLSAFVKAEVEAGRCALPKGTRSLQIDLAVLVGTGGPVKRIVPRAINCPTVEQYASGLLSNLARDNLDGSDAGGWYHASFDFTWAE